MELWIGTDVGIAVIEDGEAVLGGRRMVRIIDPSTGDVLLEAIDWLTSLRAAVERDTLLRRICFWCGRWSE